MCKPLDRNIYKASIWNWFKTVRSFRSPFYGIGTNFSSAERGDWAAAITRNGKSLAWTHGELFNFQNDVTVWCMAASYDSMGCFNPKSLKIIAKIGFSFIWLSFIYIRLTMNCFTIFFSGQPGLQVKHKTFWHKQLHSWV